MSDLHLLAATVLSHCLLDAENMTSLQTSGSLLLLLSHITDTTANSDMKECATAALAKAAQDGLLHHTPLIQPHLKKIIVRSLWQDLSPLSIVLHCFLCLEVNRRILHEQNVEKTFIQLLSHSVSSAPLSP